MFGEAAAMGDLNGDGFVDVVIGAPGYDLAADARGLVYAYFGSALPDAGHDLFVSGEEEGGWFGGALSMGDVNDDGYSDLLVGAKGVPHLGAAPGGRVFLFLGGIVPDGVFDSSLVGTGDGHLGSAVAMTADLNGDGIADAVLGAPGWIRGSSPDPPTSWSFGSAYIVAGGSAIDLASGGTLARFVPQDAFGFALASSGDFDGDGAADLLVGAPGCDMPSPSEAFLWLGGRAEGLAASPDIVFMGSVAGDLFGSAVE